MNPRELFEIESSQLHYSFALELSTDNGNMFVHICPDLHAALCFRSSFIENREKRSSNTNDSELSGCESKDGQNMKFLQPLEIETSALHYNYDIRTYQ